MVLPVVVPIAVELIINKIPVGSGLDDVIKDYSNYWGKIIPTVALLVLQLTNTPEYVDIIVSLVSAEVVKVLKKRNSERLSTPETKKLEKENFFIVSSVMATAKIKDFVMFQELLKSVSEKQRAAILGYGLSKKKDIKILFSNFISMTEAQFKDWVEIMFPSEKPKEKSEFEKEIKKSLKKFNEDCNIFFAKETWLGRKAKEAKAKKRIET
jgi:hypothetical protein